MSSMGNAWPDDGMDGLDFPELEPAPSQPGIIPVTVTPQIPSLIPLPGEDSSATQVPFSAYAPAPALPDPNGPTAAGSDMPGAEGIAKAFDWAGYFPEGAAIFARNIANLGTGSRDVLAALKNTTPYLTAPLAAGAALAGTISDVHQGVSTLDAAVGNFVRGGLVFGAGLAGGALTEPLGGVGSIPAIWAADNYLPAAPQIGHAVLQGILPPPSFDPAYDPLAF